MAFEYQTVHVYLTKELFGNEKELGIIFRKLHRQFGHSNPDRLVHTIAQAYPEANLDMLKEVASKFACQTCGRYRRPPKRPVASHMRVPEFNHEVGADIFWVEGVMFLHMM